VLIKLEVKSMSDPALLGLDKETIRNALIFAVPAFALLVWDYLAVIRAKYFDAAYLPALFVMGLYLCSLLNRILLFQIRGAPAESSRGAVMFMVSWPLLGIPLAGAGFFVGILAPKGPRWRIMLASILLLVLTFKSMVAPN
jgi:hypothetical protein